MPTAICQKAIDSRCCTNVGILQDPSFGCKTRYALRVGYLHEGARSPEVSTGNEEGGYRWCGAAGFGTGWRHGDEGPGIRSKEMEDVLAREKAHLRDNQAELAEKYPGKYLVIQGETRPWRLRDL